MNRFELRLRGLYANRTNALGVVLAALLVVQILLTWLASRPEISNDVFLYDQWMSECNSGHCPVLDYDWVYPFGAFLLFQALKPVAGIDLFLTWQVFIYALNALTVVLLVRHSYNGFRSALFYVAALLLIGPVGMFRLDAVLAPLIILALLFYRDKPWVAALLGAIGAWIKIFPAAILAILAVTRSSVRRLGSQVVLPALTVSVGLFTIAAASGGASRFLSFLTTQNSRNLNSEAVVGVPFQIARLFDTRITDCWNASMMTTEICWVDGSSERLIARFPILDFLDLAMAAAVALICLLAWRKRRSPNAFIFALYATLSAMIFFNRAGSPQFFVLPAAAFCGLILYDVPRIRWPMFIMAAMLLATHILYPHASASFALWLTVIIVRTTLFVALFAWSLVRLSSLSNQAAGDLALVPSPALTRSCDPRLFESRAGG